MQSVLMKCLSFLCRHIYEILAVEIVGIETKNEVSGQVNTEDIRD